MSVKLSVGFQKKFGLPDYGSQGASCAVEFEIEPSLLQNDLERFHEKARRAFAACQQAVNEQLARQQSNGTGLAKSPTNGNGRSRNGSPRPATQSQARAIRAIASRQRLDLAELLGARFHVARLEDLSISDASRLIDELKASPNGPRDGD